MTPEQIEQFVRDSLMRSAIGGLIEKSVREALAKSYDNPIDKAIQSFVVQVASEMVRSQFQDKIKAAVQAVIETKVTPDLIASVVDASVNKMISAAHDYKY